jgi:hypothetical protein
MIRLLLCSVRFWVLLFSQYIYTLLIAISQFKPLAHLPVSYKQIFHVSKIATSATNMSVLRTSHMLVGQLPCDIWHYFGESNISVHPELNMQPSIHIDCAARIVYQTLKLSRIKI